MASYSAQGRQTNSSEDEEYYFLQPMFEKLPPNEIISEKYAPDVVPQVKLMYDTLKLGQIKTNVEITYITFHQKPKILNYKITQIFSISLISWESNMPIKLIKLSISNSIIPNII